MNTAVKVGLWAVGIGVLFYIGKKSSEAYDLVKGIAFRIVDFGIPKISGSVLSVPLKLGITNETDTSFTIDNVNIAVSILQKGNYLSVGGANINNVVVGAGFTHKDFIAQVDLKKLTSNILDTLSTVLSSNAIDLKADVLITTKGVTLPVQTLTKSIRV